MDKYTPIELGNHCNASKAEPFPAAGNKPRWDARTIDKIAHLSLDRISTPWVPFKVAIPGARRHFIVLPAATGSSTPGDTIKLPIGKSAHYVCIAHCCASRDSDLLEPPIGIELARYTLVYADGEEHQKAIRRHFEIDPWREAYGDAPFAATSLHMRPLVKEARMGRGGLFQTGVAADGFPGMWIYALPNPHTEKKIKGLRMQALTEDGIAIFGITLTHFPEHPLRLYPRNTFRLSLPGHEQATPSELDVTLDMGWVTGIHAPTELQEELWLKDPLAGLGKLLPANEPKQHFVFEATGTGAASFKVQVKDKKYEFSYREALSKGEVNSPEEARIKFCYPHKIWVHLNVTDSENGKLIPTRVRFLGPHGEYIPPYGHPAEVNTNWFEDEGGNVVLGSETFAYVPGEFKIELPVGDVFVEISKGFEYEPVRKKLRIDAETREVALSMRRFIKMREQNFVTADTHIHFLSPQTAWLEGQCEGLNLVNVLATQWGNLFTNVSDITGKVSGCSEEDTIVFVGTENRHHLLGHMSMLGTKGIPVFPMCTGGPTEAWFGDPDIRSQIDWAEECRTKGGVVIRPHFPSPNCEIAADIILGKVDALEVRNLDVFNDSLDSYAIREWYRYLNCGYRIPAVGGTDKMSAGTPVGGVRTYAKLEADSGFSFDSWGKAVRAGRTFTTSGPLIELTVEGQEVGDELRLPASGGTLEVETWATCAQPIHGLELVSNGKVIAKSSSKEGSRRLELKEKVRVDRSGWLAARCFSHHRVWHMWPLHLLPLNIAAHTSPIYIIVGNQRVFNPSDAVYMMTLIHGGMEWLDTFSTRADEHTHRRIRSVFELAERELHSKLNQMHSHHL